MADQIGYERLLARRGDILLAATGLDYGQYERGQLAFDFDAMMTGTGYSFGDVRQIQLRNGVGATPMLELPYVTRLVRRLSEPGKGARILVKDEAANISGSFKDRRASLSAHHARVSGFEGIVAATSGNYGAAVAAQAARHGLRSIVVQEAFDSAGRGQPEILEKGRKCATLGAEVLQTTVGPELFAVLLLTLEETGYFNASLYTPFSVLGIETLGWEIAEDCRRLTGRDPACVLATHAGGGMVTGVKRGLQQAGAHGAEVVAVSVDLQGLHLASDRDFNRKSFTTGHTGFSIPFSSWPDRVDVPRNAARPLRYIDRFVTVTQGEAFYATELMARKEGLERGPAGNTSMAAALAIARELDEDDVLVVSETEYTGAGKSPVAQLEFAERMGIRVGFGDPRESVPGESVVLPDHPSRLSVVEVDLDRLRKAYVRRALDALDGPLSDDDARFLAEDIGVDTHALPELLGSASH